MQLSHHSHRARGPLFRKIVIFLTVKLEENPHFLGEKMSAIFFLQNTALELDQDNGKGKKKMSFAYLQVCQKASQIQ